jgi:SAM-dependent methyltransferase
MGQITTGIHSVLSIPFVYSFFQNVMGTHRLRINFVREYVRPLSGESRVLDIGCGPADILAYLPPVEYYGFDISGAYINKANTKFGSRGQFFCRPLLKSELDDLPKFDIVLAMGVLHHMDDEAAKELCELAYHALKPGGRFVTFDPCFAEIQNPVARYLVSKDRGQNVRDQDGYRAVAGHVFKEPRMVVQHRAWIPYTHCFMECTR